MGRRSQLAPRTPSRDSELGSQPWAWRDIRDIVDIIAEPDSDSPSIGLGRSALEHSGVLARATQFEGDVNQSPKHKKLHRTQAADSIGCDLK